MKKNISFVLLIGIIVFTILAACAPKTAPATSPTQIANTAPAPAPVSAPTSNISPSTSQDDAWAKTVQAAQKEGKVTVYAYLFTGDVGLALSQAFKQRYGIQLDIVTGRGAEFIERIKTEKRMGSIVGDLHQGNIINARIMKDEGLTANIASELPVLREKDAWVIDILAGDPQDKEIFCFNISTYTPWVNTNLVKPGEEPKVWKDFLDPKWKGKITAMEPVASPGIYQWAIPLMREKVIDEGFLKALYAQDVKLVIGYPQEAPMIARGERAMSISATESTYAGAIAAGAPIRAVSLEDGTPLGLTVVNGFKGGPHPNATKVFINWILSQEGQTVWGKAASVSSVRKDVPNFLPKAAQVTLKRPITITLEDSNLAAKWYQERWLVKLWGK